MERILNRCSQIKFVGALKYMDCAFFESIKEEVKTSRKE